MVQFLPVAGSWRCKEGIYQRRPVRWWRWVFTASFLHAWSPHQSDGGSEGEIFIPPAHCKITYLGPMSPPPPQSISAPSHLPPSLPHGHYAVPAPYPSLLWPILCLMMNRHQQLFWWPGDVATTWAAYSGIFCTFYPLPSHVGDALFES